MAKSAAQKMANRRYRDKVYDQITIEVPKGKRDEYKTAAEDLQLTFKALIQNGVEEFIKNHAGEKVTLEVKPESVSAADRRLLESFGKCPEHVKPTLKKLIEQIAKGGNENGDN